MYVEIKAGTISLGNFLSRIDNPISTRITKANKVGCNGVPVKPLINPILAITIKTNSIYLDNLASENNAKPYNKFKQIAL